MSGKVPERFWSLSSKVDHDVEVVRADVADEWKRQRDNLIEALRESCNSWEQRNSYAVSKELFPPWFERAMEAIEECEGESS